jgi:hypothetical protein
VTMILALASSPEIFWKRTCRLLLIKLNNDRIREEFENDFYSKDVNKITVVDNVSVISIIGQDLSTFHKPYSFDKNKIVLFFSIIQLQVKCKFSG